VTNQGDSTGLEGDQEDSDSWIVHKVLDGSVSLLRRHTTFKSADLMISQCVPMQNKRDLR
jgi:hypothetical protein